MRKIILLSLFLLLNLGLGFDYGIKVNRLIILNLNLTPDLSKVLLYEYQLLSSKLGIVCEAYTNQQIRGCINSYKAKEIWYVYIGHSRNGTLGNFLSERTLKFPKKVDYIFLDGCKTFNNSTRSLLKYVKKGIWAWKTNAPYLGMIYLFYYHLWDKPKKAINLYNQEFHKRYKLIYLK